MNFGIFFIFFIFSAVLIQVIQYSLPKIEGHEIHETLALDVDLITLTGRAGAAEPYPLLEIQPFLFCPPKKKESSLCHPL